MVDAGKRLQCIKKSCRRSAEEVRGLTGNKLSRGKLQCYSRAVRGFFPYQSRTDNASVGSLDTCLVHEQLELGHVIAV